MLFRVTQWMMMEERDAILSVQLLQHREVTELRWNGATELIRVEVPEKER